MSTASGRTGLRVLAALLSGTIFGAGLALAGMIDPLKVLAFLDVSGHWDPSLAFVMGGAVVVAAVGFHGVLRRRAPVFDASFHLPPRARIDAPLLFGAALFGAGWGLAGYCPGPVIGSLSYANAEALWFVPALVAGTALQRWQARRRSRASAPGAVMPRTH